jgi:hypothetical protein
MRVKEREKHVYLLLNGWRRLPRYPHNPICYVAPFETFMWCYKTDDAYKIERERNGFDE